MEIYILGASCRDTRRSQSVGSEKVVLDKANYQKQTVKTMEILMKEQEVRVLGLTLSTESSASYDVRSKPDLQGQEHKSHIMPYSGGMPGRVDVDGEWNRNTHNSIIVLIYFNKRLLFHR